MLSAIDVGKPEAVLTDTGFRVSAITASISREQESKEYLKRDESEG